MLHLLNIVVSGSFYCCIYAIVVTWTMGFQVSCDGCQQSSLVMRHVFVDLQRAYTMHSNIQHRHALYTADDHRHDLLALCCHCSGKPCIEYGDGEAVKSFSKQQTGVPAAAANNQCLC